MRRAVVVAGVVAALCAAVGALFRLEDDPIRSLVDRDPTVAALFEAYQGRSPYRGRIFVEDAGLAPDERARLEAALAAAGYVEATLLPARSSERAADLVSILPAAEVRRLLAWETVEARADELVTVAGLPGGGAVLRDAERDPFGLVGAVAERLRSPAAPAAGPAPRVFQSPPSPVYERLGIVYDVLVALGDKVRWIGGDFFAVESYRAVRHDIALCSVITLILNLALFRWFTRQWIPVVLVAAGSLVSYLAGVLAVRVFYAQIFAIVLAYTSTFVGFNNESLVHLAGLERTRDAASVRGMLSAIGTTLIGFFVLLLGGSVLVRQMALASIAGLLAFLAFLVPYRTTIAAITFRTFRCPTLQVPGWVVGILTAVAVAGIAIVGVPAVETDIGAFRYQTARLGAQVDHFTARLAALSLDDVVAVPVTGEPSTSLRSLAEGGAIDEARHPLARFSGPDAQRDTLAALEELWAPAARRLAQRLDAAGLRLAIGERAPGQLLTEWSFLERVGELGPVTWAVEANGRRFVLAGLWPGRAVHAIGEVPLSPRRHYGGMLTALSRELAVLFLIGLAAMGLYLVWIQRDAARTLYILAPVAVAALSIITWVRAGDGRLDVVHFMGFSLVIAIAMDYTAVAVSTDHAPTEMAKVLLSGLCALATFGALLFAEHPLLHRLGATVVLGAAPSLLFALFVRLEPRARR
jgi:hypothetical protein